MKQDEIIEMARQVGLHIATGVNWMPIIGIEYAEAFAKLAAAHEREECAKMVDHILKEGGGTYGGAIRARGKL